MEHKISKVGILTDSTSCIPAEFVDKYKIYLIPMTIIFQGKSYKDGVDLSANEVYRIMREKKALPTTSTPSTGDFLTAFQQLSARVDSVLCITLSKHLSKTYETAITARDMAKHLLPAVNIQVVDSKTAAGALGLIVMGTARAINGGASLEEAVRSSGKLVGSVHLLAILDTLYYLARGGRIGRAAAWAGALLDFKPVVELSASTGEVMPVCRPRTKTKAIEQMLSVMKQRVEDSNVHVIVHHADEPQLAEALKEKISSSFKCAELYITEFTPLMGIHTGPGLLAVSFYKEN